MHYVQLFEGLSNSINRSHDSTQCKQDIHNLQNGKYPDYNAVSVPVVAYHRSNHQPIIPPKGPYQPYPNKTSQTHGDQRNGEEDNGDDEDGLTAAGEFYHLEGREGITCIVWKSALRVMTS